MELIDRDVLFNSFNDCSCECGVCQYSLDGLPCGLIENAPTVEAIPKDQYEARLKADMAAMLTEIHTEIEELKKEPAHCHHFERGIRFSSDIIQQKINELKENTDD